MYLVRHGRTALNADGGLRGLSDSPLDEVGQVEAKRLVKALAAFGDIGATAHLRVVIHETEHPILEYLLVFTKVQAALQAVPVQWTYDLTDGDPVDALLAAANAHAAWMIVVGRPEHGLGATLGHMLTNAVTRTLIRRSPRPVVVVPDVVDSLP